MQPIAKNNCDFPTLRQSGCVYVDKTGWFHRLATDPQASFFFLARPRRFGKAAFDTVYRLAHALHVPLQSIVEPS